MRGSFTIGKIAGIEIGVHYSWLLIFALFAWTLSMGFFPAEFPDWSTETYWITGISAALLLFVSVLIHELAHSLVALARGLPVGGITLFIFGGVTNIRQEARTARDEFTIAVVGPLTSLILGAVFYAVSFLAPDSNSPLAAILIYLALINLILGIFNLLPGFPLDGGRVLRSILWGVSGSLVKATNWSARVGQLFGWLLIAFGVWRILAGDLIGGLWTIFIGWFLSSIADASRREVELQAAFRGIAVRQVMETNPPRVSPDLTLDDVVGEYFLRQGIRAAPVFEGGSLVGIVTLTDVRKVPRENWSNVRVDEAMTRQPLCQVGPNDDLYQAMRLMDEQDINQVLVCENGNLAGILNRSQVIRYLNHIEELGIDREKAAR